MRVRAPAISQGIESRASTSARTKYQGPISQFTGATLIWGDEDLGKNAVVVTLDQSMDWRGRILVITCMWTQSDASTFKNYTKISPEAMAPYGTRVPRLNSEIFLTGIGWDEVADKHASGQSWCPLFDPQLGEYIIINKLGRFYADIKSGALKFISYGSYLAIPTQDVNLIYQIMASENVGPPVAYP